MSSRLATYVDRSGKPPAATEILRLESADAVKLAKFFAALGFTVEKQATPEGRQYVLAKATHVELSIVPSRTPQPAGDWSMTLMVDDVAAAASRAEAAGGSIAGPVKDIPGGKKCVVASPEGQRVVVAQLAAATKPAPAPMKPAAVEKVNFDKPAIASKPSAVAKPVPAAKPLVAEQPFAAQHVAKAASENAELDVFDVKPGVESKPAVAEQNRAAKKAPVSEADEDEDPTPDGTDAAPVKTLPANKARLLQGVRVGSRVMATGILLPIITGVAIYASTASLELTLVTLFFVLVPANLMVLIGKGLTISKNDNVVDSGPPAISLGLDVMVLIANAMAYWQPQLVPYLKPAAAICGIASAMLFLYFLGQVAMAVRDHKLASSANVVTICFLGFVATYGIMLGLGFVGYVTETIGMILLALVGSTGFAAVALYVALLVAFARVKFVSEEPVLDPDR